MIAQIIVTILIASSALSCSTDQTYSKSPVPLSKSSSTETHDQNLKIMNASQLQAELGSIEGQIASLDGMIANAQARIQSYQSMNVLGKEGMIAGAQGELLSYEGQKSSLIARKSRLQSALLENQ